VASGLTIVTAPALEPVTAAEAKLHCRIDAAEHAEDTYVGTLITAARQYAETFTRRALVQQTWKYQLDEFPADDEPIQIPLPPLSSVSWVKYYDSAGTYTTLSDSSYVVDIDVEPGRIGLASGCSWPDVYDQVGALEIQFVAGYGSASASVPAAIRQAMLLLIAHWYEHREEVVIGAVPAIVSTAAVTLLRAHRWGSYV